MQRERLAVEAERFFELALREERVRGAHHAKYIALLKAAARLGHPGAQESLALAFEDGIRAANGNVVLRRSPRRARELYEKAASSGNIDAFTALGYCHDAGVGGPRSE